MSEHLFKFLLSELTVIRIHCRNDVCGGVVEIPLEKLGMMFAGSSCPLCHRQFDDKVWQAGDMQGGSLFQIFAKSVERLRSMKDKVEVEFVIPTPSDK